MGRIHIKMDAVRCGECSLALRRFIGGLDGVRDVIVERGMIAVDYDDAKLPEDTITTITKESIEKLGYRIEE